MVVNFCAICREDVKEKDIMLKLPCSHYYHKVCWREHIKTGLQTYYAAGTAIFDKKEPIIIKCPECRTNFKLSEVLS